VQSVFSFDYATQAAAKAQQIQKLPVLPLVYFKFLMINYFCFQRLEKTPSWRIILAVTSSTGGI
jgi:hypothetical protein